MIMMMKMIAVICGVEEYQKNYNKQNQNHLFYPLKMQNNKSKMILLHSLIQKHLKFKQNNMISKLKKNHRRLQMIQKRKDQLILKK